jgi:hypothetical protein
LWGIGINEEKLSNGGLTFQDAHDVALLHDQEFFAVDLDFGAGPFAEQDAVAFFDVERDDFVVVAASTWANSDNFAFLRLFSGVSGMMMPPAVLVSLSTRFTTTRS